MPVSPPRDACVPSFYAFSFPKSGSTLMEQMLQQVCGLRGLTVYNPSADLFRSGTLNEAAVIDDETLYAPSGYCFGVFRGFPPFIQPARLAGRKAIMLVRDPRDILTSFYYSLAISHSLPGEGKLRDRFLEQRARVRSMSIDEFVTSEVSAIEKTLDALVLGLRSTSMRLYRYEDVVFGKREWLSDISHFLGLGMAEPILDEIAARHDVRPEQDRPDEHVRQVLPGDYRRKLRPDTVEYLDARAFDRWRALGYPYTDSREAISFPSAAFQELPTSIMVDVRSVAIEDVVGPDTAQARIEGAEIHPARGAEILALWIEDASGRSVKALKAGTPFTLAYRVRAEVDESIVFGFRIASRDGATVFGMNTQVLQLAIPPIRSPRLVEVRWRVPGLDPGQYLVTCGCSRPPELQYFFARHVDAYQLSVAA